MLFRQGCLQLLVYERRQGLLNEVAEIGQRRLDRRVIRCRVWHYTTPMLRDRGVDDDAALAAAGLGYHDRKKPRPKRRLPYAEDSFVQGSDNSYLRKPYPTDKLPSRW